MNNSLDPGSTNFQKVWKLPAYSMGQKNDLKQRQNWKPTVLEWPVTLTGIWCFLHSICEMIHIFVHKGKNCNNDTKNIRCHHTKLVIQDLCTPALHKDTCLRKGQFPKMKHNVDVSLHWPEDIAAPYSQLYGTSAWSLAFFTFWSAVLLFYILITTQDLPSSHRYCPFPHMDLWYTKTPTFPSLNDSTSSYTPGSSVSYPAHKLLAVLFHITLLKILLRSAVIHAHTYTGKF